MQPKAKHLGITLSRTPHSLSNTSFSLPTYPYLHTSVCSLHTTIHNKTLKFSSIWTHVDRVEKVQPLPQPRLVKLPNLVILTAHLMTTTKTCRLYCNPIILSLVWRKCGVLLNSFVSFAIQLKSNQAESGCTDLEIRIFLPPLKGYLSLFIRLIHRIIMIIFRFLIVILKFILLHHHLNLAHLLFEIYYYFFKF